MTATYISNADFSPILLLAKKLTAKVKQEKKRRTQAEATDQCGHASFEGFFESL